MRLMKHNFPKVSLRKLLAAGAGVVILGVVAIRPAHPQFGFDIAAILAGLQQINSTLGSAVAAPLRLINQVEQQERQFQQQVLYPVTAINSARQMANGFSNSFLSFRQLGTMNISSAQLPNPQQLERQMLSANPNNIASIAAAYQSVFSPLPAKTAVPQNIASQIDMGDAQAQDAIKKAIELDALACARDGSSSEAERSNCGFRSRYGAHPRCRGERLGGSGQCVYTDGNGRTDPAEQRRNVEP